jgi:hypothetical protein
MLGKSYYAVLIGIMTKKKVYTCSVQIQFHFFFLPKYFLTLVIDSAEPTDTEGTWSWHVKNQTPAPVPHACNLVNWEAEIGRIEV